MPRLLIRCLAAVPLALIAATASLTASAHGPTKVGDVDLELIGQVINSASGTVRVINADYGMNGTSAANAALFDFSGRLGSDQIFSPNETTDARTVKFQDSAKEMFTWDVQVTAYVGAGSGASGPSSSSSSSSSSPSGGGGPTSILPLAKITAVMRFTVNPLTKTVTSQLIKLN